jgi:DDB1- and CUL4-associated factor 12
MFSSSSLLSPLDCEDQNDSDNNSLPSPSNNIKRRRLNSNGNFKFCGHQSYSFMKPTAVLKFQTGKRIRSLTFNRRFNEIAAMSTSSTYAIHTFDSTTLTHVLFVFSLSFVDSISFKFYSF